MSKAFSKEDDAGDEAAPVDVWPAGVKNYLTPAGLATLKRDIEAARAAAAHAEPSRRAPLEARLQALLGRLGAAEVVDAAQQPRDVARFGASVTVADEDGATRVYRIVGVDEADPRRGWISWRAPVARALVGCRVGDEVEVRTPTGVERLTVATIAYD